MKELAVGLMSGTSGDGVSVVLASFKAKTFKIIDYATYPYSKQITGKIEKPYKLNAAEISSLNFELGKIFSNSLLKLIKKNRISPKQIAVAGSHGHTIYHGAESHPPSTFQIGEPAIIAEETGITVVSDFRTRDIAAGGQGAPLIPFFDDFFFGNGTTRAMQNIGGIANVTLVGKKVSKLVAFDTGPGNCLMDWAARKISNGNFLYDKNGERAGRGKVLIDIVQKMAEHPYFKKYPPKSTGKELFNEDFIPKALKEKVRKCPYDVLSTLTYFTAFTIAESYKRYILKKQSLDEVVVSGGGAFNKTLMAFLKELLAPAPVYSIEKYGIHPQEKEPLAFAFFALRAVKGRINHCPGATGAHSGRILGKITRGKNFGGII